MKLFGWFNRSGRQDEGRTRWRGEWEAAVAAPTEDAATRLSAALDELAAPDADVEVEREMLEALERVVASRRELAGGGLPEVDTHHRVIGSESCHFTAPASLSADASQAAGRVLLTGTRAVFVGGGRTSAVPWHAVHEVLRLERDVLLVRADKTPAAHYRFNTYGDAVLCRDLALGLKRSGSPRRV